MTKHYKNIGLFLLIILILRAITRFFVFSTNFSLNSKIFFGLFLDNTWAMVILVLFFILFSLWYYFKPKYRFPIIIISAGILSNLLDRIFFKGVIDYLNYWFIPTFNLADVLIVVGALLIFKEKILTKKSPQGDFLYLSNII